MIKVCDAIMGSGKTESAISMMNSHPDRKYIFITPYLSEASRIKQSCPALHFVEPSDKIKEFKFSKANHTHSLIKAGRNVATTHQAFLFYTNEMLELIREQKYTLVVDENVNVLESLNVNREDLDILVAGGYLDKNDDMYTWTGKEYHGTIFRGIMRIARTRGLVSVEQSGKIKCDLYYWVLPYHLFTAFDEVYVLTYLFDGQPLFYFTKMYDLAFEYIGVEKNESGYHFCEYPGTQPEYVARLKDKINLLENDKLNDIGDDEYALSVTWFDSHPDEVKQLKKNMSNYFNHRMADIPAKKRIWGSTKSGQKSLQGKGYIKSHLMFNARATNEFRDRICLAYMTNVFMNVGEKIFFQKSGAKVSDDQYALSIMIQWIWRSGIRDGKDIYLYLPSRRMREILKRWLNSVTEGSVGVSA